jgi:hypothetical protein
MIERGQDQRFTLETREAIRIEREGRRQDFQRDIAVQLGISRAVHFAITPAPSEPRTS